MRFCLWVSKKLSQNGQKKIKKITFFSKFGDMKMQWEPNAILKHYEKSLKNGKVPCGTPFASLTFGTPKSSILRRILLKITIFQKMLNTRQTNFENDFFHFFFKNCYFWRKLQHAFDKRGQFSGKFEANEWKHGPKWTLTTNCKKTVFCHFCVSSKAWRRFATLQMSMNSDFSWCFYFGTKWKNVTFFKRCCSDSVLNTFCKQNLIFQVFLFQNLAANDTLIQNLDTQNLRKFQASYAAFCLRNERSTDQCVVFKCQLRDVL